MRHPFFAASRPLVFAHRGGAALKPENTFEAFDHGMALGADGLELDVHLSRDGEVVVHHDRTLDRTTRLTGPVAARTADELQRGGIARLADVLTRYDGTRLIIELKVNSIELARAVVDAVRCRRRVRLSRPSPRVRPAKKSAGRSTDPGCVGRPFACRTAGFRSRSAPARRASPRLRSSRGRIAPDWGCTSGRSMTNSTPGGSSGGRSTA